MNSASDASPMLWPDRLTSTRRSRASRAARAITQRSIAGARSKRSAGGRNSPGMMSSPSSPSMRTSSSSWTCSPLGDLDDRLAVEHEPVARRWRCRMRNDHSSFARSVVLALLALGDVGADAADPVDVAVRVAQRELLHQVGALAPVTRERAAPASSGCARLEHLPVAVAHLAGQLGREEVRVAPPVDRPRLDPDHLRELAVGEQVAEVAVLREDHRAASCR